MRSTSQEHFARVPRAEGQRSSFDRSHGLKTTFDSGYLVPIFVDEALPGDTFNLQTTAFARLATPIRPVMDNMQISTFYFAVPIRLVWDNFQKFMGEQANPGDSTDYLIPTMEPPAGGYDSESLSDYFGIPIGVAGFEHSSLWHRAYNLIWNEWFRDENLQDSIVVDKGDGPDDPADYTLLRRGKRHDYFTSCLPWPQKGPEVDIPLGTQAPVNLTSYHQSWRMIDADTGLNLPNANGLRSASTGATYTTSTTPATFIQFDPQDTLKADLTQATAATINQLREAFQIQRLFERDARGGTRYTEIVRSHFRVTSPDQRLQRPEYLGGGKGYVTINPVAQTSSTDSTTPQANLAAVGTGAVSGHGFTKSFTEHTLIIGLMHVGADLTYQQGLNRMFSRQTRFDFYWPTLSSIGEQEVLNKEIYVTGTSSDDDAFGYQERYAEYRYKPSLITGKMRSQDPESLDVWHLAQDFDSCPALNSDFIEDNPPLSRVLAVQDEPQFIADFYHKLHCARPMPLYGVPGMIDHF